MITKLDDRRRAKQPLLVNDQLAMLERIDVALDEEQIGATLHWQEARTRDIDAMGIFEVLDRRACGGLEL